MQVFLETGKKILLIELSSFSKMILAIGNCTGLLRTLKKLRGLRRSFIRILDSFKNSFYMRQV